MTYSETTAATMTHVLCEIARTPKIASKIRDELNSFLTRKEDIEHQNLQGLSCLNSIISETLRLHPPAGPALKRLTPKRGIQIGETWISGLTTVFCPYYVIGRSKHKYEGLGSIRSAVVRPMHDLL